MKRGSLLAIGGIVLASLLALGAAVSDQGQVGRFQIAGGECQTRRQDGRLESVKVVLLLDTATGQARALYAPEGENIRWSGFLMTDGAAP
jgi:hypothetical protein